MKKDFRNIVIFLISCILCSCTSNPKPKTTSLTEYELFSSAYIAARGYGESEDASCQNALATLSRYFSSQIKVETAQKTIVQESGSQSRLEDITRVLSDTELFAVHYTKPKFNKTAKQYEVISYINRAEALKIYEPKIKEAVKPFLAIYSQAEIQRDLFKKAIFYLQAKSILQNNSALKVLQFLHVLSPDEAENYADVEDKIITLNAKIKEIQKKCTVSVNLTGAMQEQIKTSIEEVLLNLGFPLSNKNTRAAYICKTKLAENKSELQAGVFFTPTLSIDIVSQQNDELVFSYKKSFVRMGASTEVMAKKRMEHNICSEIKMSLPPALKKAGE